MSQPWPEIPLNVQLQSCSHLGMSHPMDVQFCVHVASEPAMPRKSAPWRQLLEEHTRKERIIIAG